MDHRPSVRTPFVGQSVNMLEQKARSQTVSQFQAGHCRCTAARSRPSMNSQSILPASCTSSCLMLMIWSSRARNRSADPVVSCFFGRIAPSDARPNHASRFEGIAKTNLQASRASDTETLQSQVNKAAKKRLSLNGLEILHGRLSPANARSSQPGMNKVSLQM